MNALVGTLWRAWRSMRRSPALLLLSSVTLALGVATFAGAFAFVDALLLTPPPFANHANVVVYGERQRGVPLRAASPMLVDAVGTPGGVLSTGSAQTVESVNVRVGGRMGLLRAQRVDTGFLPTLGVPMQLGTSIDVTDRRGVVVSAAFWASWLGADPLAIGRRLTVDGTDVVVRGVLPVSYRFEADVDILIPSSRDAGLNDNAPNLIAIARLAPGTVQASFHRAVQMAATRRATAMRIDTERLASYGADSLDDALTSTARTPLLLFAVAALFVLLVAGINLSNLMLTRSVQRAHEAALAVAFGAHGWRARLAVIADVLATGAIACGLGMPAAWVTVRAVRGFLPDSWPISAVPVSLGWRPVIVAIVLAILVTVVAALLGSLQERPDRLLRMHLPATYRSRTALVRRARAVLVLVQVSLATLLVLLSVASVQRWWRASEVPPGFVASHASFVEVELNAARFPTLDAVDSAATTIRQLATRQSGISAAGITSQLPVGQGFVMPFRFPDGSTSNLQYALVTPGASEAMGLQLVEGRRFTDADVASSPRVAIVNQAYVDRVDPRGVAGHALLASRLAPNRPMRIVGVVSDTPRAGAEHAAEPTVYVPLAQAEPAIFAFARRYLPLYVVARGPAIGPAATWPLAKTIGLATPGMATGPVKPLGSLLHDARAVPARAATLIVPAALLALVLAGIGLYSVQAIEVVTRQRDLALRGALGATPVDLFGHVVSRGMGMAIPGVALGLLIAIALQFVLAGRLAAARPGIVVTSTTALLMLVSAIGAVALPSLRAARMPPLAILRGNLTHQENRP